MKLTHREPTPEMVEAERVRFEAWCDEFGANASYWCGDKPSGYHNIVARDYWTGWKARAMHDAAPSGWQPIETAPKDTREMFVVRAFRVTPGLTGVIKYTSDPWCVWRESDGSFSRWPHDFPPTHWMPLPAPPSEKGE